MGRMMSNSFKFFILQTAEDLQVNDASTPYSFKAATHQANQLETSRKLVRNQFATRVSNQFLTIVRLCGLRPLVFQLRRYDHGTDRPTLVILHGLSISYFPYESTSNLRSRHIKYCMTLNGHFALESVLGQACHRFACSGLDTKLLGNKQSYTTHYIVSSKTVASLQFLVIQVLCNYSFQAIL